MIKSDSKYFAVCLGFLLVKEFLKKKISTKMRDNNNNKKCFLSSKSALL